MSTPPAGPPVPLVTDLDGTLVRTDTLLECFWKGMGVAPGRTLRTAFANLGNRAALKARLAEIAQPEAEQLPLDRDVAGLLASARAAGRPVHLVSGAATAVVAAVADAHGPFDGTAASDETTNLTREAKADFLRQTHGEAGFDYIGDSTADIPVWRAARQSYVARPTPALTRRLSAAGVTAEPLGNPWRIKDLILALRPHQWLKNLLLVLPLFAAHRFDIPGLLAVAVGFAAFSALASAIYIVNDLTDLDADRRHESKHKRPLAAGRIPIKVAMATSLGLGAFGLLLGFALGWAMLGVLVVYMIATISYSFHLKRVRWVDVAMLAALYTLRVVAGAAAAGVAASGWLFGFIFPIFLCLGCVKRLTELSRAKGSGFLPGRRYQPADMNDLLNVSIVAAIAAVGVFLSYSTSDTAARLYDPIWALILTAGLLTVWLGRMIITGWEGRQDYDPIIYAITDRIGVVIVTAAFILLVWSGV